MFSANKALILSFLISVISSASSPAEGSLSVVTPIDFKNQSHMHLKNIKMHREKLLPFCSFWEYLQKYL